MIEFDFCLSIEAPLKISAFDRKVETADSVGLCNLLFILLIYYNYHIIFTITFTANLYSLYITRS